TLPLDLDGVMHELTDADRLQELTPPGTTIGHVHLQVADLASAEAFYSGTLGFDVVGRGYPGALFVSAGGYHHHIGLNPWPSRGAAPAAPGSIGLRSFEVLLHDGVELDRVLERVGAAGIAVQLGDAGALVRDPSGNRVVLRAAA